MSIRLCTLLLLATVWASSVQAAQPHHDALERYVAWRGGSSFLAISSLYEEGQTRALGADVQLRRWLTSRGVQRVELDYGPLKQVLVSAPDPWQQLNGRLTSYASEDAHRSAALGQLRIGATFRADNTAIRVSGGPARTVGGDDTVAVHVRVRTCKCQFELLIDPASGELRAIVDEQGQTTSVFSEWRQIDGVRVPVAWEDFDNSGERVGFTRLTDIRLDAALEEDALRKPLLPPGTERIPGTPPEVPMTLVRGTRPYLPAKVGGRPVMALLDSGAAWTVLSSRFAEDAGITTFGSRPTVGSGGVATARYAAGLSVDIGSVRMNDLLVLVLDLDAVEQRLGISLPVILGKDLFDEFVVDLDFRREIAAFHPAASFTPPSEAIAVDFAEKEGHRAIPVSVEGHPPAPFVFDTGNGSFPILIHPGFATEKQLRLGRTLSTTMAGAVGGSRPIGVATFTLIDIGGVQFRNVPAGLPPADDSAASSPFYVGNVGMEILGRFRLITDHSRDQLWLLPDGERISLPFQKDRLGLNVERAGDGLKIVHVSPGSPASRARIEVGHSLLEIDGLSAPSVHTADPEWTRKPAGTRYRLKIDALGEIEVTLAEYF